MASRGRRPDKPKERHWRRLIHQAAGSGVSIREFCRREGVKESQFYRWQRRLKPRSEPGKAAAGPSGAGDWQASFALVSDDAHELGAIGIELVLSDGRRLRIGRGVDESTLRTVLAVLEPERC